ncbi:hypothetical protein [Actinomadura chibensis]|nr:hypothetical protein [Actinomadura chibensis]
MVIGIIDPSGAPKRTVWGDVKSWAVTRPTSGRHHKQITDR